MNKYYKNKKIAVFGILALLTLTVFIFGVIRNSHQVVDYDASLLIVGDNMLSRSVGEDISAGKNPYQYVKNEFGKYDIVVANLECVISDKGKPLSNKNFILRGPLSAVSTIKNSGIDVLSLANNHSKDYGSIGMISMMEELDQAEIEHVGGGKNTTDAFKYKVIEKNGIKIAFLAFNEINISFTKPSATSAGSMWNDMPKITKLIQVAKKEADIVLVLPHWGVQYDLTQEDAQIEEARQMIDVGADIVVGSHPHVVQGHEVYKGKNIYYSLGNFLFNGNNMDKITTKGYGLEIFIKNKKIVKTDLRDVFINKNTGYPSFGS